MILLERFKSKLRAKREDTTTRYWGTLQKIADGKLSERGAEEALEALADVAELLNKTADDVQADVEMLEQLADAESRTKGHDEAKKVVRAALEANAAAAKRVEELLAATRKQAAEGEQALRAAQSRVSAIESAQQECAVLRNKLGKAGHPQSQHRCADDEARDRFETRSRAIESQLDQVARDLKPAERELQASKEQPPRFHGDGDSAAAAVANLHAERDRLTRELDALREEEKVRVAKARTPGRALGGAS